MTLILRVMLCYASNLVTTAAAVLVRVRESFHELEANALREGIR